MRRLAALLEKETRMLLSEQAYLLSLVFQLFVVASLSQLILAYVDIAYTSPSETTSRLSNIPVAVVGVNDSDLIEGLEGFMLINMSLSDAQRRLAAGDVFAVLVKNGSELRILADPDNILSGVTLSKIESGVQDVNRQKRSEEPSGPRIRLLTRNVEVGEDLRYRYENPTYVHLVGGLIIPFIVFLPLFVAMGTVGDSIVGERKKKTLEELLKTPLSEHELVLGKTLPPALLAVLQAFLWLLILSFSGVGVFNHLFLFVEITLLSLLFSGFGVLFSTQSKSLAEAGLLNALFGIAVTVFFLTPLESTEKITKLLPIHLIIRTATDITVDVDRFFYSVSFLLAACLLLYFVNVRLVGRERK